MMLARVMALLLGLAAAVALPGCGQYGPLELPPEQPREEA